MSKIHPGVPVFLVFSEDLRDNKKDFTFEISSKDKTNLIENAPFRGQKGVYLKSTKTNQVKLFQLYKVDKDGSNEDIYGWRYRSHDGFELLIIND